VSGVARRGSRLVNAVLGPLGLRLVRRGETVVLPRPRPGPRVSDCPGVDWNPAAVAALLDGALRRFRDEYNALPVHPGEDARGYGSANPYFGFVDAAVAWALLRARRPSEVVEVGSGFSTRLLRHALERNGGGRLTSIDPQPRVPVTAIADRHLATEVQQVPAEWFAELPADTVLFIDSSHRAGTASDVNHLLLDVLPRLAPGVLVHVHDVYLPEDYPVEWNLDRGFLYSEQYLLQALLAHSAGLRVVWPGRWVVREQPERLAALLRRGEDLGRHCSFWLERVAP
jgi:methyltransferase family protein